MRTYVRTGRNTGASLGFFGSLIYLIGLFFAAAIYVVVFAATALVALCVWGYRRTQASRA